MGIKLSICGKGGSGKSTLTALLAQQAVARGFRTLVVDSDESNSGLYRALGFEGPPTSLMDLVGGKTILKGKMQEKNILAVRENRNWGHPCSLPGFAQWTQYGERRQN